MNSEQPEPHHKHPRTITAGELLKKDLGPPEEESPDVEPEGFRVPLCIYSQSEGGTYTNRHKEWTGLTCQHVDSCPLDLTRQESSHCPCKPLVTVGEFEYDGCVRAIRVSACSFPVLQNGDVIQFPAAFSRVIKLRIRQRRSDR